MDTVVKLVSAKANEPMEVTEAGISTDSNEVVLRKAAYSIEVTESGITTVFKCVPKKTDWPIADKEFDMLTVFIGVFAKASTPMDITELGITNESKFDSKKAF